MLLTMHPIRGRPSTFCRAIVTQDTHKRALARACLKTHALHAYACTHMLANVRARACTRLLLLCTHAHTRTHALTHKHSHARTHAHTHPRGTPLRTPNRSRPWRPLDAGRRGTARTSISKSPRVTAGSKATSPSSARTATHTVSALHHGHACSAISWHNICPLSTARPLTASPSRVHSGPIPLGLVTGRVDGVVWPPSEARRMQPWLPDDVRARVDTNAPKGRR